MSLKGGPHIPCGTCSPLCAQTSYLVVALVEVRHAGLDHHTGHELLDHQADTGPLLDQGLEVHGHGAPGCRRGHDDILVGVEHRELGLVVGDDDLHSYSCVNRVSNIVCQNGTLMSLKGEPHVPKYTRFPCCLDQLTLAVRANDLTFHRIKAEGRVTAERAELSLLTGVVEEHAFFRGAVSRAAFVHGSILNREDHVHGEATAATRVLNEVTHIISCV